MKTGSFILHFFNKKSMKNNLVKLQGLLVLLLMKKATCILFLRVRKKWDLKSLNHYNYKL